MNETTTYVIMCEEPDGVQARYVGEALDAAARFKRHQRDAADPTNTKSFYEFLRSHNITRWWYEVVEGVSEAEAVEELTLAGAKLFNDNRGISTTVKRRKDHTFAKLNRAADERIERRQILHNTAQNYSKAEVVRQRITGDYPTLEELLAAQWTECPPELLSADVGRTAEWAHYCKLGDISVFVAYKNKDRMMSVLARHRDGRECRLATPRWYGPKAPRDSLLKSLIEEMDSPYGGWEKVYRTAA